MCYCVVKASAIKGQIRFNERIFFGEDLLFRFECYGSIKSYSYIPKVKYHYYMRKSSVFHTKRYDIIASENKFHEELAAIKKKCGYPDYADRIINAIYINSLYIILPETFSSENKIGFSEKLDIIDRFVHSSIFKKASRNYEPSKVGRVAGIYKHFNRKLWIISYLVYFLVRIKKSRYKLFD
jgi:hypothetical protein